MRERVKKRVGENPSTLNFILPRGADNDEVQAACELMWRALEKNSVVKLNRGFVYVKRVTKHGIRRGIVAALDLEECSCDGEAAVRLPDGYARLTREEELQLRKIAPAEFPATVVLYRDKKFRAAHAFEDEELEELYDFDLMEEGGHVTGYFVSQYLAESVLGTFYTKKSPAFVPVSGIDGLACAKRLWENLKGELNEEELANHPARFHLVELVNLYDETVEFRPEHRLLKEVDSEAFCSYFSGRCKCRREGNVLLVNADSAEAVEKTDALIAEYRRANGGRLQYVQGEKSLIKSAEEEDCAGVMLRAPEKEDFFDRLHKGGSYPLHAFVPFREGERRYHLEGREVSYD